MRRKSRLHGTLGALALFAGSLVTAPPAAAAPDPMGADLIDWAPPDAEGALVIRQLDAVKSGLQHLDARFGQTRTLKGVVPRLLAFERGGARPFAGDLGPGIDTRRGFAAFAYGGDKATMRYVLASTDAAKARATLAGLLNREDKPVTVEGEHLKVGHLDFTCVNRGPWLVCDSGSVPETAPGRTDWLSADAWLEVVARGAPLREFSTDLPLSLFSVRAGPSPEGGRMTVHLEVAPAARPMLAAMVPGDTPVGGADCVDQRSAFVGRISVDAPKLFAAQGAAVDGVVPPDWRPLWLALKAGFTGEILFSGAGGMAHPLLTLGVRDAGAGEAIVKGLVGAAQAMDVQVTASPGTLTIAIPTTEDSANLSINLRYGIRGQTLVFGLAERDVERCVKGEVRAAPLPPTLAGKGATGFVAWALPTGGLPPGLFAGSPDTQVFSDLAAVAGVAFGLIDELGLRVAPSETAIDLDIWCTQL
jgi:hypothetical protein